MAFESSRSISPRRKSGGLAGFAGSFIGDAGGLIGGLMGAEYLGKTIEGYDTSGTSYMGWAYNNVPKLLLYLILKSVATGMRTEGLGKGATTGLYISMPTSIVLDTYSRFVGGKLLNMNPNDQKELDMLQNKISTVVQDNANIRIQLNSALQRLEQIRSTS